MKKPNRKLDDIFAELGMPSMGEPMSRLDAVMLAESEGGGITYAEPAALETCDGKVRYPTFNKAEAVKKRCLKRRRLTHLCSYQCPKCHGWHLTSTRR
jgi:hypothetical protein